MAPTLIRKRSGSIADFDRSRIESAIARAYKDCQITIDDIALSQLVDRVLFSIDEIFDGERIPSVEEVQDIVEKEIANKGDFEVSKSYILYRQAHAEERFRKQQALLDAVDRAKIKVRKRSGKIVPFDIKEIEVAIENICQGFEKCVDIAEIVQATKLGMYDGISTTEINKVVVMTLKSHIERDPAFSYISARFLINDLYKDVIGVDEFSKHFDPLHKKGFIDSIHEGVQKGRLDPALGEAFDLVTLSNALVPSRDSLFEFMGIQVLYDRYFIRDSEQKILETPQYFWMRVAMGLALPEENKTERAIEFYNTVSQMLYVPSTPTLLHSGTHHPQMSSCFLSTTEDDLHHIFKVIGDNAQLSKWSGGVANDWTNIRATNALVKSINTGSQGVIPFLKIVDATTASINRSGKRRGATCVYLETWHYDIEQFLDLRKNTGDERLRTHDTNTANWVPDLFMKRVETNGEWTLFSPDEVPELHDLYGKAFEEKYEHYESLADQGKIRLFKRMKAQDLWRKMLMMLYETGHPWITFKDPANIRSPQDHVGVVHSSNLCTEITLNTSKEETAVCNIGSINLARHVKAGVFDWAMLERTVTVAIRMLDNVIDVGFYPIPEAKYSNMRHRPIGLGIMGTQDVLFDLGMNFDSTEAVDFSDNLMEFVSWHAIMTSSKLAKEKGAYETFKGSKWDRNLFPVDTVALLEKERGMSTGIMPTGKMDWTPVREHVKEYGMRNSNTMAIAPTATISNISGCLPSVEPIYKNIYVKSNFSGEFTVVNSYLVNDLKERGLWTSDMLERIKYFEGNLSHIGSIPQELKDKYKETFQIEPYWIIAHAAHRGKWIDQSQSINIFLNTESGRVISDAYLLAWKMGLKTTYYLRTLGATAIEKSTIDINKKYDDTPKESPIAVEPSIARPTVTVVEDATCESCQ
ncbi:MAG TPA: ribonucleoside-diphosphate reductase subunit alpha [Candidatus Paceibacterota bacterium]|nr:ribonucleoside-diphosphate reductase subunit alpha [Candidatus Paceibacterota bacterium]